jgi:predicted small lipoprotein YifL
MSLRRTCTLLAAALIAGCGQKGNLYLPGADREAVTSAPDTSQSDTPQTETPQSSPAPPVDDTAARDKQDTKRAK